MSAPTKLLRLLRFTGRVQFTMILLLAGTVAMAAGTILETQAGGDVARASIYHAVWFDALLFLIAVNLVAAVWNRIPIRRHQWAFVLTHFSIVVLLAGAWVSRSFGVEGRLAVREGETTGSLWTDGSELHVRWRDGAGREAVLVLPRGGAAGRVVPVEGGDLPPVRVEDLVADGEFAVALADAGERGSPGVELHLAGKGVHRDDWLIADDRFFRRKDLGRVEVELLAVRSDAMLRDRLAARDSATAVVTLRPRGGAEPLRLELPRDLHKSFVVVPGIRAVVDRFVARARVAGGKLTDDPAAAVNPAACVDVSGGGRHERHTVFSQFPQFHTVQGRVGAGLVESVTLDASAADRKPLATLLVDPRTDRMWIQLSAPIGRGAAVEFRPGQTVAVGNLGIDLEVRRYLRRARAEVRVRPAATPGEGSPWLRVAVTGAGEPRRVWLRRGSTRTLDLGGRTLELAFAHRSVALPFTVALDRFEIGYHPGSRRPSSYASHVRLQRADGGERAAVVSMNRPVDYDGYRLFQSSYRLGTAGAAATTILSVSRDPGAPIVYAALAGLIAGIAWYLLGSGRRARVTRVPAARGLAAGPRDRRAGVLLDHVAADGVPSR